MVPAPAQKVEVSRDDFIDGNFPESTPHKVFHDAVQAVAERARVALPQCNGSVDNAVQIVLAGDVIPHADGRFAVGSQSDAGLYYVVDNECTCPDADTAPDGACKHVIATWIWRKADPLANRQLETVMDDTQHVPAPDPVPGASPEATGTAIPAQFIVQLHGKDFVQYAGLLAMAHERGLVNLSAHFISVDGDLALAEATAEFQDGRTFGECADATPANVNPKVKAHFARMALTRAKARALRDALNIAMCSVEELEG